MTMGGNEAQPVRLIAVDSEGIPVTDPQILQAAAEQAGIQFVSKDENDEENSITIDQAMQVFMTSLGLGDDVIFSFRKITVSSITSRTSTSRAIKTINSTMSAMIRGQIRIISTPR